MCFSHFLSFFSFYHPPRHLLPFPTRRSSDLHFRAGLDQHRDVARELNDVAISLLGVNEHGSPARIGAIPHRRSEEHTSELQSLRHLVCRLLLEKNKCISISIRTQRSEWIGEL